MDKPQHKPHHKTDALDTSLYAAIDLGSNSFHLIVIRKTDDQIQVVDSHKEMIRLRSGLDEQGYLTEKAFESGITCLAKFGQLLNNIPENQVRAVGTNTLRNAKNSREFIEKAEDALGHDIDIVTGEEEARLIFLGVSHGLAKADKQHLIIDIGGGSTEFIIGADFKHKHLTSTEMGCVSISQLFFKNGNISDLSASKAINYCRRILRPHSKTLIKKSWEEAMGASGSIKSIGNLLKENALSDGKITLKGMQAIKKKLIEAGSTQEAINRGLKGLKEERMPVFIGGLAILISVFQELKIKSMQVSASALREGLIYDNLGRLNQKDVREASVAILQNWLKVDQQQSERIAKTAQQLLENYRENGKLKCVHFSFSKLLAWAAKLHEGGMSISYKRYRYHSAYLVKNAELAGFSQQEQQIIAAMVLNHQGKFNKKSFDGFNKKQQQDLIHLTLLLRLAVLLHRDRENEDIDCQLTVKDEQTTLAFQQNWLDEHPLSYEDLEAEAKQYQPLGLELFIRELS